MSSMADRLSRRTRLTGSEIGFLEFLTDPPSRVARGELIQRAGLPATHVRSFLDGWAMTFSDFPDGSRDRAGFIFPAICWRSRAWRCGIMSKTSKLLATEWSRRSGAPNSPKLFAEYPRLAAIMFIFTQEERITYGDRLCSLAGFPPRPGLPSCLPISLHVSEQSTRRSPTRMKCTSPEPRWRK